VNWPLILEFVKALAAPTAAVVAVIVASKRAVEAFRAQKLIERRLTWYEGMIEGLKQADRGYLEAFISRRREVADAAWERLAAVDQLGFGAMMYADRDGVDAVLRWQERIAELASPREATVESARSFTLASADLATILTNEVRKDLRLGALPSSSPMITKWGGK